MTEIAVTSAVSRRNVVLLAICQGLMMVGTSTMVAEAALVGSLLADDKRLATLPLAVQQVVVMATVFPASFLMARIGRKHGFTIGALAGALGTTICALGILQGSFWLFVLGSAVNGLYNSFAQFYRFAAVDGSSGAWKAKAISYTMAGGVLAAVIGPELAKATEKIWEPYTFAGSFAALSGVAVVALLLLQFLAIPRPPAAERKPGRPLAVIARQPAFIVAVLAGTIGYGSMSFIMTATPLAMQMCGFAFADAATTIQLHLLAMFVPAFFTGHVIQRLGPLPVIVIGAVLSLLCAVVNLLGIALLNFWTALILLGVGWNFMFVGGSTLLTATYRPEEKATVQACNDFCVFGTLTVAALSAGAVVNTIGWAAVNIAAIPLIIVVVLAALWLQRRRVAPAAS
ncbi:MAG: MFS transporter [Alphaproteobacteria bacterium]|nr:MFS transporter [Alphaproteobacteria bacterium]